MKCSIARYTVLNALFIFAFSAMIYAQTHVHGQGRLLIAQDDNLWQTQLIIPSSDILGFESKAHNSEQAVRITYLEEQISSVRPFIELTESCELMSVEHNLKEFRFESADGPFGHDHNYEQKKKSNANITVETHDLAKHSHENSHVNSLSNMEHKSDSHKDLQITYVHRCKNSLAPALINVFELAPSLEKIEVQWLTDAGQGVSTLGRNASIFKF